MNCCMIRGQKQDFQKLIHANEKMNNQAEKFSSKDDDKVTLHLEELREGLNLIFDNNWRVSFEEFWVDLSNSKEQYAERLKEIVKLKASKVEYDRTNAVIQRYKENLSKKTFETVAVQVDLPSDKHLQGSFFGQGTANMRSTSNFDKTGRSYELSMFEVDEEVLSGTSNTIDNVKQSPVTYSKQGQSLINMQVPMSKTINNNNISDTSPFAALGIIGKQKNTARKSTGGKSHSKTENREYQAINQIASPNKEIQDSVVNEISKNKPLTTTKIEQEYKFKLEKRKQAILETQKESLEISTRLKAMLEETNASLKKVVSQNRNPSRKRQIEQDSTQKVKQHKSNWDSWSLTKHGESSTSTFSQSQIHHEKNSIVDNSSQVKAFSSQCASSAIQPGSVVNTQLLHEITHAPPIPSSPIPNNSSSSVVNNSLTQTLEVPQSCLSSGPAEFQGTIQHSSSVASSTEPVAVSSSNPDASTEGLNLPSQAGFEMSGSVLPTPVSSQGMQPCKTQVTDQHVDVVDLTDASPSYSKPPEQENDLLLPTVSTNLNHPAPLPPMELPSSLPRPTLSITGGPQQIILGWQVIGDNISHYEIFAYEENAKQVITSSLWQKLHIIKPKSKKVSCSVGLLLPQTRHHFVIRALDVYNRKSLFSAPASVYIGAEGIDVDYAID